jgi:hypothetical protein
MLLVFSIVASLSMVFRFSLLPIGPGVDPPVIYAYNYAAAKGAAWGRDFISTYGPYGYLVHTMDVGNLVQRKIAFNLLHAIGCGMAVAAYLRFVPALRPAARLTLALVLIYAMSLQYQEYRWFSLFVLVFLISLHRRGCPSLIGYSLAGVLAGFCLLIKFSVGLGTLVTLGFGCLLVQGWRDALYRLAVAVPAVSVSFVIGWMALGRSLSEIGAYVATGWDLTNGYSSAQSWDPSGWRTGAISFLMWFLLIALWVLMYPTSRNRLTLVGLAMPLFMVWKHAIVRQDNHVFYLVTFGFFALAILLAEAWAIWPWRSTLRIVGLLLVPLLIPWFSWGTGGRHAGSVLSAWVSGPLKLAGLADLVRLSHLAAYRSDVARASESQLRRSVLPESIRTVIDASSVDVYPWDVSYVPANGLSWANRPQPASFLTFTPDLDRRNAAFFLSESRPRHIVWHTDVGIDGIDGRYLFWDEPETFRAIMSYYDLIGADARVLLLRARAHPRFAGFQPLGVTTMEWNTWVPVPQPTGVLLANASINRSLLMSLIRTLFREDPVYLSLRFSSGQEARYRLVPDNMRGLWVSPFAATVDEMLSMFQGGPARRVIAIRFSGRWASRLASPITVSWFQSMSLQSLDQAATPTRVPTLGKAVTSCAGFIESVNRGHDWNGRAAILASGWARDGDSPIAPENLWLIDGSGRVLDTEVQTGLRRLDIAQGESVPSLERSGWTASARTDAEATDVGFVIRTRGGGLVRSCNKRG